MQCNNAHNFRLIQQKHGYICIIWNITQAQQTPYCHLCTHTHTHTHTHTAFLEADDLNLSLQRTQALLTQFKGTAEIARWDATLSQRLDNEGNVVLLQAGAREFSSNGQHWITSKPPYSVGTEAYRPSPKAVGNWSWPLVSIQNSGRRTGVVNITLPYGFMAWRFSKHMSQLYLFVTLCFLWLFVMSVRVKPSVKIFLSKSVHCMHRLR